MARIAGRYPEKQESVIALTYIFGLGRAIEVLEKALVKIKVQDWNDDEIGAIREAVSVFKLKENYVLIFEHQTFNGYWLL
jgi:small subunit ribosomal protein S13